jgi:hypothetical protein
MLRPRALELDSRMDCTPGGEQGLGCWIDSLVGVLILEFDRAPVSERGVEPALVVDLVDEAWKRMDDVGECLVAAEIHLFGLERLHEALGLSVVIGDTTGAWSGARRDHRGNGARRRALGHRLAPGRIRGLS